MSKRFVTFRTDKSELTPQGFLRMPAYLTRTGVFKYRKADGSIIRELRHPDDVFHPDSIQTLQMAPVTDDHPSEFVTPDNVRKYSVGWISEKIDIEDKKLITASVIVADSSTIKKIDNGKREVSCGYHSDLVEEHGIYDGEEYDYRQTNIRYNHVAIVNRGRAGPLVRLRLDSDDAVLEEGVSLEIINDTMEGNGMKTKTVELDGKEFEVPEQVANALEAAQKAKTDAEEKAKDAEEKLKDKEEKDKEEKDKEEKDKEEKDKEEKDKEEKGKGDAEKLAALQAKVDHLEEKLASQPVLTPEQINDAVKERIAIEKVAASVLGTDAKLDGKDNLSVMKEVITKHSPKTDLSEKSEAYIIARFDAISEGIDGYDARRQQLARPKMDNREDSEFDAKKARERATKEDSEAWKKPLATAKA